MPDAGESPKRSQGTASVKDKTLRLVTAVLLTVLALPAWAQTVRPPSHLIELWGKADELCRGLPGGDREGEAACQIRDDLMRRIRSFGFCYGMQDQISTEFRWHACTQRSLNR
jgi:hypothetical protein